MNLMVTTNQILIIGTRNIDRKSNITLSQVTKSQGKEQEKKGAENYQKLETVNKVAINTYLSITIFLNAYF